MCVFFIRKILGESYLGGGSFCAHCSKGFTHFTVEYFRTFFKGFPAKKFWDFFQKIYCWNEQVIISGVCILKRFQYFFQRNFSTIQILGAPHTGSEKTTILGGSLIHMKHSCLLTIYVQNLSFRTFFWILKFLFFKYLLQNRFVTIFAENIENVLFEWSNMILPHYP